MTVFPLKVKGLCVWITKEREDQVSLILQESKKDLWGIDRAENSFFNPEGPSGRGGPPSCLTSMAVWSSLQLYCSRDSGE